ncbi:uncharacterized protein [Hetaerina americana]|uniref:uncharacterized protein isoform X4 n=1 Tax=Hetaerina americana TaxID=62018 RepID=UPI003A7F23D1
MSSRNNRRVLVIQAKRNRHRNVKKRGKDGGQKESARSNSCRMRTERGVKKDVRVPWRNRCAHISFGYAAVQPLQNSAPLVEHLPGATSLDERMKAGSVEVYLGFLP